MYPSRSDADESYLDPGIAKDVDEARAHTVAKSPTSGPGAEQQHEDEEEDYSKMAENFSKMAEKVRKAIPPRFHSGSVPTIYVVPRDLAEGTKDSYEPEVVCIGPLFDQTERRKKPRRKLESYKWCCLRKLLVNAGAGAGCQGDDWIPDKHEGLLSKCLDTMRELEQQIRASYGDIISVGGGSNTLALMMLLDGSFLLHRLMVEYARMAGNSDEGNGEVDNDDWTQVVGRCGTWGIVTRDLLLLKNQIPFFILQKLFEHLRRRGASDSEDALVKGGLHLFASLRPGPAAGSSSTITCRDVHHLLHLFYMSAIGPTNKSMPCWRSQDDDINVQHVDPEPRLPRKRVKGRRIEQSTVEGPDSAPWVPSAKELEEAGVSFQANKHKQHGVTSTTPFHNVSFRRGICGRVLKIPPLELYDYSEALFRNLIAFEQTYLHTPGIVTAYALFMDCLIKTPEDMRLLHHSGVLVSHMNGERDVTATGFFGRVCAQAHIFWDQNYLDDEMRAVVGYQSKKWPRWRAALIRDYFCNPWVTTSLIAAFVVLLLTFLQTFFAVYAYYKPSASN